MHCSDTMPGALAKGNVIAQWMPWWAWLRLFLCLFKHGPQVAQLQAAAFNITMELKHEPKAADIVIQFVLLLGN